MKIFLSLFVAFPFLLISSTASAQVISGEIETAVAPPKVLEISLVTESENASTSATTTNEVVVETEATSTVDVASTSGSVLEDDSVVVERIEIIPGSVSLKLTSPKPVVRSTASASLTPTVKTEDTDGLFNLIYTGFEEFVFRVFGI